MASETENPSSAADVSESGLIFDNITLEHGTIMTVFHCPVIGCQKRNYLDARAAKTHIRKFHNITNMGGVATKAEAQCICQVRAYRKLFM